MNVDWICPWSWIFSRWFQGWSLNGRPYTHEWSKRKIGNAIVITGDLPARLTSSNIHIRNAPWWVNLTTNSCRQTMARMHASIFVSPLSDHDVMTRPLSLISPLLTTQLLIIALSIPSVRHFSLIFLHASLLYQHFCIQSRGLRLG